jgi:hypothetical protein
MNEHKAMVNERATEPISMPMKNNVLGTTAPVKNNVMGTATAPVKNNVLGTTTTAPMKNNVLGMTAPMKNNVLGTTTTAPMKSNKPDHYRPGGHMADYDQTAMQPAGHYPTAMPRNGMVPSMMPQTGMEMPYAGVPAPASPRSIFQPAAQQGQGMMQQSVVPPRTSIMTSGLGARDSVLTSTDFTQGFLQTQIGRHVKVEFLLGTNMLIDREGDLVKVGTDYIIIQETETDDYLLCDIYSIRFIRFYY